MNLQNVSYAVGVLPVVRVTALIHGRPDLIAFLVGTTALGIWIAFVNWMSK